MPKPKAWITNSRSHHENNPGGIAALEHARRSIAPMYGVWLLSIGELPSPLEPGSSIWVEGKPCTVYEVRRFKSLSSPIAGKNRPLFAVLHSGPGSVRVVVCLNGRQREWSRKA
jgi:hypothetical protein